MSGMTVCAIKTRIFHINEDLVSFVVESIAKQFIHESMIMVVTSKIVSLSEGRFLPIKNIEKVDLVRKESDVFLGESKHGCFLTIKHGLFIPSAGIDESNSESGDYILYPENPFLSANQLWTKLREKWNIKKLGVVITDSHTTPLRKGVTGICLAYWGFEGLRRLVGTEDLFGRQLKMTNMNLADGLAVSAVMMMGEGKESQPLAVISGPQVTFSDATNPDELKIPIEEDLYAPFLMNSMTIL